MLDRAILLIDAVIAALGRLAALFVLCIIVVMVYEMVLRGIFGASSPWTSDVSAWLLVGLIFLGGPWALARGNFVRVDALFARFSPRTKAIVDSTVSTVLFALFVGVLINLGGTLALRSFAIGETSATGGWDGPVWVAKWLVPIGGVLLSLAWISHLAHAWRAAREEARDG